ncbi:hypothetical protein [Pseudobdellovibrio exovorus]|uniref:Uncharacterized protein n=1 Tax=Pseudobdellovibrio exovorus JSS TaxID=1184267 RepID=M4VR17_9BACT|nr:hypothetical protein [Pseudobdellovibrio exovorus]AGH95614.1 hypothetical protein A11Q_1398 [Pseudobdellovibrio exovorus JSS]
MRPLRIVLLSALTLLSTTAVVAIEYDADLAESLKIEASHNLERLKSYRTEIKNNKIFENEREKGLAEFLEEQERWELQRERGVQQQRRARRSENRLMSENSPEYREYLKELQAEQKRYERNRETYVATRNRVLSRQGSSMAKLESEEYDLMVNRPRYDLTKRRRNKWVTTSTPSSGGGFSGGTIGGGGVVFPDQNQNPIPPPADFLPVPDFPAPAEVPYGEFDELPVPPPIYDGSAEGMPFDSGFGAGDMSIPPPPPPPPDFDF